MDYVVVGHFTFAEYAKKAIVQFRKEHGDDSVDYYAPFPEHHLEDAQYEGKKRSPVRRCTMLGGLTGCLGAFLFTSWMSLDYPLRVSAKPLLSVPSFVVIAFECTILLGAIFTLLGMGHFSKIPDIRYFPEYNPKFSEGTFGVVVKTTGENTDTIKAKLEQLGADEVEVKYVR
jgi:Protein of unknown function (DUF3341)